MESYRFFSTMIFTKTFNVKIPYYCMLLLAPKNISRASFFVFLESIGYKICLFLPSTVRHGGDPSSSLQENDLPPDLKQEIFTNDAIVFTLKRGASICLFLAFPFSQWEKQVHDWSLLFPSIPTLRGLIKMKRDCFSSAFWQPWQNCSSNLITFWFLAFFSYCFSRFQRIN